jgi:predicted Rossmann fold nucleotide-binding protein DprA/Smf involved in DNA uptake
VAISGNRNTRHRPRRDYHHLFAEYLAPFLREDALVIAGGAAGIDTLALDWALAQSRARILVALPGRVDDQPAEARDSIVAAARWSQRVEVVELRHADFSSTAAYHSRNRWMVDRAGLLVAFPRGDNPASGTWHTIGYAADRGLPRLIVPI